MTPLRPVTSQSKEFLAATHVHYVYRRITSNNIILGRMDEMHTGHYMILGNGTISRAVRIEEALGRRLYNLRTDPGDAVVNRVILSAYIAAIKPSTLPPSRLYSHLSMWRMCTLKFL